MIVEDQTMPRELFELRIQTSEHFEVALSIDNAALADVYCLRFPVDLILMDVVTRNGESGLDAAERIKRAFPQIKIIIVTSKSDVKAKADLSGKVVGVQDGSSAVDAVNKEAELAKSMKEIKKFGDNVAALMDLSTGRLDAVVVDEVVGRYYTSKKPGEYKVLEENFGSEDYGVGLRKDDTELLAKLDNALDAMKTDGTAQTIYAKWFEEAKK